jgi:hypothetical protein
MTTRTCIESANLRNLPDGPLALATSFLILAGMVLAGRIDAITYGHITGESFARF